MIFLYSGTPGSGKSLHQAKDIYHWVKSGHICIANFDIDVTKINRAKGQFIYLSNDYLLPETLIKFSKVYFSKHKFYEGAIRLYIDECQLLFNCREWNIAGRKEWLSFFTQHRKYGYDIYLVAQFDRMIDRQVRSLIEYEVIHRKATNHGLFGAYLGLFVNLFVAVTNWYPMHERLNATWFTANKKYYSLYDTYNTFDGGGLINENNVLNEKHTDLSIDNI